MSHKFSEIPQEKFAEFHRSFHGERIDSWKVCHDCGGRCEHNKIGSLLPGEAEFITRTRNLYISKYIDTIETPFGIVEVLELKPGCPFLFNFHCSLDREKAILCDTYPIVFKVSARAVRFSLDPGCPLRLNPQVANYFKKIGIPALKKLDVPLLWWQAVATFDRYNFDYEILAKLPRTNGRAFTLEQILTARK